jgi:uroporphyrinogen decarboxylase
VLYPRYFGKFSRIPKEYAFGYGLEHAWGLIPEIVKAKNHTYRAIVNHPLAGAISPDDIKRYKPPGMDEFDFSVMKVNERIKENAIYCVGSLNQIFMIASFLRGMDNLLLDMAAEPVMAETLINKVAEVAVDLNRRSLQQIGSQVDVYVLWDDVAMQDQLIMSPTLWKKYLKKWYENLFGDAQRFGLKNFYHCCGNVNSIIPGLIDMGVDVLDPVQTSALDMDLRSLRKKYGKNLSYHGGLDVQNLLPYGSVEDVKKAIKEARFIFGHDGGIILGPSHEITPDTPLENILAIYN